MSNLFPEQIEGNGAYIEDDVIPDPEVKPVMTVEMYINLD